MIQKRLAALREEMKLAGVDYYIVPTSDFHESEYVGKHFKARHFITGFSGSAGIAVIEKNAAKLWTDGRYFIQAAKQLEGTTVELMKMGEEGVPTIPEYLKGALKAGEVLGFDGRVISKGEGEVYKKIVENAGAGIKYDEDLIDKIWADRPAFSEEPAFLLAEKYAGESAESKVARIREEMRLKGATLHILTTLDDICWTLNIRGNDVAYSPLVLSYMILTLDRVILYADERKFGEDIREMFAKVGVEVHPYNAIYEEVKEISDAETVMFDPDKVNYALYHNLPEHVAKIEAENPEILMKAIKNPVEIENIRKAEIKDSVAHVRFMKWLKENVASGTITEMSASDKLDEFRKEMGNFIRPSFGPISSYGEHGAIVHYSSSPETDVVLKEGKLFLTDTGAGFYEGSTDITRTYALGEVPQIMKDHFTIVAISNLNLASAKFLSGCTGNVLDILARKPFWDRGLDYNHGTGHGVGYLLNIHEGPCSFRWRLSKGEVPVLHEGMIITDEPGIYIEGSHGIRLENEVLVSMGEKNEYGQFMYLDTITFVPFDLDAINPEMMTAEEKQMLNNYHKAVYENVAPYLNDEEKEWLAKYTREI